MEHDGERLEALLRQFQPRAPGALPEAPDGLQSTWLDRRGVTRGVWWVGVTAAAAAAVLAANLRFMPMAGLRPDPVVGPGLTLHDMRSLIDADVATRDRALIEASKHVLPDVDAPDSVLGRLAQP